MKDLISAVEAAEVLGVSSPTFYKYLKKGGIPTYKAEGRPDRFSKADIVKWKESGMGYKKNKA